MAATAAPGKRPSAKASLMERAVSIRPMTEPDLPAVAALECAAYPYPWSEGSFRDSLLTGDDCWLLEVDDELVGHGVLTTVLDDATVLNIAIHPRYQQQGWGQKMLSHLLMAAKAKQAKNCFLEVRKGNVSALALYARAGFQEVGCRRGYYPAEGGREDALVLQLEWK